MQNQSYRVSIKRLEPPPNQPKMPPGVGSGHFHLDIEHQGPVVLIGGGIRLTPVLSMLNYIAETGSQRETWLFYGLNNSGEYIMPEHLREIEKLLFNFHLVVCYSRPLDEDTLGLDYEIPGHVSVDLFKKLLPSNNYHYYLCGLPSMMDSITEGLKDWAYLTIVFTSKHLVRQR